VKRKRVKQSFFRLLIYTARQALAPLRFHLLIPFLDIERRRSILFSVILSKIVLLKILLSFGVGLIILALL